MAVTNLIKKINVGGISDAQIKVFVGGTATTLYDIVKVDKVSVTPEFNSKDASGEGSAFAVMSHLHHAMVQFDHVVMDAALWAYLTGATAPAVAGTTPNLIATTNFKTTDLPPYFQFECQSKVITDLESVTATDAIPADVHFKVWKCKVTKPTQVGPTSEDFITCSFEAEAVGNSSDIVYSIIANETAVAIT